MADASDDHPTDQGQTAADAPPADAPPAVADDAALADSIPAGQSDVQGGEPAPTEPAPGHSTQPPAPFEGAQPSASTEMAETPPPAPPPTSADEDSDIEPEDSEEAAMPRMTLGEHLDDLRKRLFLSVIGLTAAMILALIFGRELLNWIRHPYVVAMEKAGLKPDMNVFGVTEAFTMYLRVALYAGIVLASPWIIYQLWMFIGAGLYKREKRWVKMAVPFFVVLFATGAVFAVFLSIPAMRFFFSFGQNLFGSGEGVKLVIKLEDYIDFMTNLVLAFGAVFQMPLVVLVLAKIGLVDMRKLNRYRRHVIVAIAAIAAVLAPPDLGSMIAMVVPMWVLYEFGVLLAWLLILRKRKPQPEGDSADP
ncbi:MAG: twin-arginine translocase subunit TatC [Phycisphaerae bacterium]